MSLIKYNNFEKEKKHFIYLETLCQKNSITEK